MTQDVAWNCLNSEELKQERLDLFNEFLAKVQENKKRNSETEAP